MSIKSTAEKGVEAAFKTLGPLVQDATYKRIASESRDGPDLVYLYATTPIKAVVTSAGGREDKEAYGMTYHNHRKILVPRKDLTVMIRPRDLIIIGGTEYRIIDVRTDPTESMYIVYAKL
ncbi:hypothetical protein DSCW_12900 [Desulfosarcina widdelii]|uniref:Phage protein n=1 Tax=Desulfosarcina widdelii TaxID=947919 RepID=A0A5K7Z1A0_9BACT|nr:hypothetical protein [Desulfosarcina widdelii]BBO73873.1 hypothetical protein DSCW_12900 [Desulfosarcina widdelii]